MPDERKSSRPHTVTIDRRKNASITGVLDVISFDEDAIIAETELGVLILHGNGLHINRLNLESGELEIDGEIENLTYEDDGHYGKNKTSILSKLFK